MEILRKAQQILQKNPNVRNVQTISHDNFMLEGANSSNTGGLSIIFHDFAKRHAHGKVGDTLIDELIAQLEQAALPDADFVIFTYPPINGLGTTNGFSLVLKQL